MMIIQWLPTRMSPCISVVRSAWAVDVGACVAWHGVGVWAKTGSAAAARPSYPYQDSVPVLVLKVAEGEARLGWCTSKDWARQGLGRRVRGLACHRAQCHKHTDRPQLKVHVGRRFVLCLPCETSPRLCLRGALGEGVRGWREGGQGLWVPTSGERGRGGGDSVSNQNWMFCAVPAASWAKQLEGFFFGLAEF